MGFLLAKYAICAGLHILKVVLQIIFKFNVVLQNDVVLLLHQECFY